LNSFHGGAHTAQLTSKRASTAVTWEAETIRRSTLTAQISALTLEMEQLSQTMAALGRISPGMEKAAGQRFADSIATRQSELGRLALSVNAEGPRPKFWADFRQTRQHCATLAREYLAFALGGFARQANLDGGLLRIADALLAELSERVKVSWDPLTVLAETEWYGEEAQIIRLRFPETSIWNLPVAAHEFGHFAGPRLTVRADNGRVWELTYPVSAILRREADRGSVHWSRMHEFFADAFAVFLTGPAYACTSLLLRFDPAVPDSDGPTHPGHAKRAYLMGQMLEKMDQAGATTSYVGVLRQLRERWRASVTEAGALDGRTAAELEAKAAAEAEPTAEEIWALLQETIPTQRYRGMPAAQAIKPALLGGPTAQPGAALTLADALNAAWLCRLDHWDDDRDVTATVAARALELCHRIADRKASGA